MINSPIARYRVMFFAPGGVTNAVLVTIPKNSLVFVEPLQANPSTVQKLWWVNNAGTVARDEFIYTTDASDTPITNFVRGSRDIMITSASGTTLKLHIFELE